MTQPSSVLIVGSVAFDTLEMPSGTYEAVLGGAATYASLAASLLSRPRLVGVVGDDFDEALVTGLRARGIDTAGLERATGKTFHWRGRYSHDLASRTTLATDLNVFADFKPKIPAEFKRSPFVLLGNIHPQLQIDVLDQVEGSPFVVADTMNFWITSEPTTLEKMMKRVDLLVINDEEARQLSGMQNLVKAARDIRARGPAQLVVKRGEYGALLFDSDGMFFVPGYPLEDVSDPTGAGDTFAGGLIGALARNAEGDRSVRQAMFFASALASFCVEHIGPRGLQNLTTDDLSKRLRAFHSLLNHHKPIEFP